MNSSKVTTPGGTTCVPVPVNRNVPRLVTLPLAMFTPLTPLNSRLKFAFEHVTVDSAAVWLQVEAPLVNRAVVV